MEYACVVWDPITQKNITELMEVGIFDNDLWWWRLLPVV
jgi:hypothetical protein